MAERRMFAKQIIDSDAFLDMPTSTQSLYFHLGMRGDDEGFINNPKKIQRMVGASDDDIKILIAKKFVIPFESGVCVIKHWKIHNYIRNDRLQETVYQEERQQLTLKNNNVYSMSDRCQSHVSQVAEQVRLGKVSLVEGSVDNTRENALDNFDEFWNAYPKKKNKADAQKAWKKHKPNIDEVLNALEWQKQSKEWQEKGGQFIQYPASYINSNSWLDEPDTEVTPF